MKNKALRIIQAFWLFTLLPLSLLAQKHDFKAIDQHARSAPKNIQTISSLANYLTQPAKNEVEKVRAFYIWMTHNIAYDANSFFKGKPSNNAPQDVIKHRMAVCQGYSELFKALCDHANIKSFIIPGYSKGVGYQKGQKFIEEDHVWNIVLIDGEYYPLDLTWGSGGINAARKFERKFNENYFLTPKEKFIYDHMPLDPIWQLLDCPISMQVYEKDSIAIAKEINKKQNCKDYKQTIENHLKDPNQELNAAFRAFEFNQSNCRVVGLAYSNLGFRISQSNANLNTSISYKERLEKEKEVLENYEKAAEYLKRSKSPEGKSMYLNCKNNIEVARSNIKELTAFLKKTGEL
jgi:hypothetical protein